MKDVLKVVDHSNVETEHICCALSDKKGENCVTLKKEWLKERFDEGLVFLKLEARGKVFIEYLPAEMAFAPVVAPDYMYINCFWVSGKFKGQGHANQLLEACIVDAKKKNKIGLVILSSKKKTPFLSDPKYLKYKGFIKCDEAYEQYELLYLAFDVGGVLPKFNVSVKEPINSMKRVTLYFTNQCPHAEKYARLIETLANDNNVAFDAIKLIDSKSAQNSPAPFTTYTLFIDGKFITNEILTEKKFMEVLALHKLI